MEIIEQKRFDEILTKINQMIITNRKLLNGKSAYRISSHGFVSEKKYESIFNDLDERLQFELLYLLSECANDEDKLDLQDKCIDTHNQAIYLTTIIRY